MTSDHTPQPAELQSVVLADAEGYRLTYHPGAKRAGTLLITFDTMLSGLSKEGFGTKFAKKRGYDHIFVAQAPDSWYQRLSLEEFEAVVAPLLGRYDKVFTYGSSLGGYAALYYAGVINARAVAAAPY